MASPYNLTIDDPQAHFNKILANIRNHPPGRFTATESLYLHNSNDPAAYKHSIDGWFFENTLQNVECYYEEPLSRQYGNIGKTEWAQDSNDQCVLRIVIDPIARHSYSLKQGVAESTGLMSTVLHECVHAYLRLLFCRGVCDHKFCQIYGVQNEEMGGHGMKSIVLASELEDKVKEAWNWNVDLDISYNCQKLEFEVNGGPIVR